MLQPNHRQHRESQFGLHLLDGGAGDGVRGALLSIEADRHRGNVRLFPGAQHVDGLANGGAGGDDVVHNEHAPALHGRPHEQSALPMVLGFLSVVSDVFVFVEHQTPGHTNRRHQRNAFVRRAEQDVERDARLADGLRVAAGEGVQTASAAEQPRVEEVRRQATRLQLELSKLQHLLRNRKINKFALIWLQQRGRASGSSGGSLVVCLLEFLLA
mmetsp:Transcript_8016/g.13509  ORF Transcript_8016/g.13509 Transcript_8016/m.13509 type:complete len:214 (-) Transcript_8016:276-917(-)